MRIALLTNNRIPAREGVARHVVELARRLWTRGHDVTVVAQGAPFDGWRTTSEAGVPVLHYPSLPLKPFHHALSRGPLARWLAGAEARLDVLHVHLPLVPPLPTVLRTVVTVHSPMRADTASIQEPGIGPILARAHAGTFSARYEQAWLDRADALIAVSRGVVRELAADYALGRHRPVVIENGVDTGFFTPGDEAPRERRALYVGRLGWRKGLARLIDAVALLPREIGLDLAGEGPLRPMLERRVAERGLEDRVRFLGFLDRAALLQRLRCTGCLVNPADYETGPLTVLEAMSSGCPVVSTRTGIVAELGDAAPLTLTEPTPADLAVAIDRTLAGGPLVEAHAAAARQLVQRHFDWEHVVDRTEAIYGRATRLAA